MNCSVCNKPLLKLSECFGDFNKPMCGECNQLEQEASDTLNENVTTGQPTINPEQLRLFDMPSTQKFKG